MSAQARACASLLSISVPSTSRRTALSTRRPAASGLTCRAGAPSVAAAPAALEHDLVGDDHVADDPLLDLRIAGDPVAIAVVGDDRGAELAGEGEDEVVGVRSRRRLLDLPVVHQLLVVGAPVDLVTERRVGDDDRLHPVLADLLLDEEDVREARLLPFTRVRDVGAV